MTPSRRPAPRTLELIRAAPDNLAWFSSISTASMRTNRLADISSGAFEAWVGRVAGVSAGWMAVQVAHGATPQRIPPCVGVDESRELIGPTVDESHREGPVAHALLEKALSRATSAHAHRLWTSVPPDNQWLLRLLEQWGFVQVGAWTTRGRMERVLVRGLRRGVSRGRIVKIDAPFVNDAQIEQLATKFESCELPYERWTHRAHLAVGAWYVRNWGFDEALQRMRRHIKLYNQSRGDPDGYHETLTQLFLRHIHSVLNGVPPSTPLHEIVAQLAETCTMAWVFQRYSREQLASREAKRGWIE